MERLPTPEESRAALVEMSRATMANLAPLRDHVRRDTTVRIRGDAGYPRGAARNAEVARVLTLDVRGSSDPVLLADGALVAAGREPLLAEVTRMLNAATGTADEGPLPL